MKSLGCFTVHSQILGTFVSVKTNILRTAWLNTWVYSSLVKKKTTKKVGVFLGSRYIHGIFSFFEKVHTLVSGQWAMNMHGLPLFHWTSRWIGHGITWLNFSFSVFVFFLFWGGWGRVFRYCQTCQQRKNKCKSICKKNVKEYKSGDHK